MLEPVKIATSLKYFCSCEILEAQYDKFLTKGASDESADNPCPYVFSAAILFEKF